MVSRSLLVLMLGCMPLEAALAQEPPPIQRVRLPLERVGEEMDRLRQPALVTLPRDRFEELVRQAEEAAAATQDPPQLARARYQARLDGNSLVGAAEWEIVRRHAAPGRLPLGSLQVALRSAKWVDGSTAVIGTFEDQPGSGPELLIERGDRRLLVLEWSVRGVPEPGALTFDLRLPPCPLSSVELELPADHRLQVDREAAVLSGPLPANRLERRRWTLTFPKPAGPALTVRLTVRRPPTPQRPTPLIRTITQTTQKLQPGQVECEFVLDIQALRGPVQSLVLECDPRLRPLEIEAPLFDGWVAHPSDAGPISIEVRLREPLTGGRITFRALAPLPPPDRVWTSPGVRVVDGLSRGERLVLQIHPELVLEEWSSGAFRPATPPTGETGAFQVIALQSRDIGSEAIGRPQARVRTAPEALQSREAWEWRIEPGRTSLTIESRFTGLRSSALQSSWLLPAGWEVEQVETRPADPDLRWRLQPVDAASTMVMIEPSRPWASESGDESRRLVLRLRGPAPTWEATADGTIAHVELPAVQPRGTVSREGTVTLRLGTGLAASDGLRPDASQPFRGVPTGTAQVRRPRGRLQARCDSDFSVAGGRLTATYRLRLIPSPGVGPELIVFTTAPIDLSSWATRYGAAQIQTVEALASPPRWLLPAGPTAAWQALVQSSMNEHHRRVWRIMLDRSPTEPVLLEFRGEAPSGNFTAVPLISVADVDRFEGHASLRIPAGEPWQVTAIAVDEKPAPEEPGGWLRKEFRYGSQPITLTVNRATIESMPTVRAGPGRLLIRPTSEGQTFVRFRFALGEWRGRTLPVHLPPGATLIDLRVNSARVTAVEVDANGSLEIPWDPGRLWGEAQITYSMTAGLSSGIARLEASAPLLPVPVRVERIWRLPAGWLPIGATGWYRLPGGADPMPTIVSGGVRPTPAWDRAVRQSPPATGEAVGAWLERIATHLGTPAGAIVIDTSALGSWRTPAELIPRPVALNLPRSLLVTDSERAARWTTSLPPDVADAVAAAVTDGRDASGRFHRLAGSAHTPDDWDLLDPSDTLWADWRSDVDDPSDRLWVAYWPALPGIGVTAAAFLLVIALAIHRGRRWIISAWLTGSGLAMIWLPSEFWALTFPPFIMAVIFTFAALVKRWSHAAPRNAPSTARRDPIVTASLVALTLTLAGPAAPPAPVTVYLVPNRTGGENVLAPHGLLDTLRTAAQLAQPKSAVLLAAHYEGESIGSAIRWQATFRARVFDGRRGALKVSLPDAQLFAAFVDGRETLPQPGDERGQFTIDLGESGDRQLVVRFSTAISDETDREVRLAVPELPICTAVVKLPAEARDAQMLTARGQQRFIHDPAGAVLQADLGRAGVVHFRWRQSGSAESPRVPVQAAHLWDVSESHRRLLSVFRYRFNRTSVPALEFDVPSELHLVAVSLRPVDDPLGFSGLTGVSDWQYAATAAGERHRLELRIPLTGQVQAELELIPRHLPTKQTPWPVPEPVGDVDAEISLGVRVRELTATAAEVLGWEPSPSEEFLNLWQTLRTEAMDREPDLAFRRVPAVAARLTLDLRAPAARAIGNQRLQWTIDPSRADLQASAAWSEAPPSGPLEWEIPTELRLSEVRGEGVLTWSRLGTRLQIWPETRFAGRPISVQLTGWMPRPVEPPAIDGGPFPVPPLRLLDVGRQTTRLEVQARDGWRLQLTDSGPFLPFPDTDLAGVRWSGATEGAGEIMFQLRPARGRVTGDILTLVESSGRQLSFRSTLDLIVPEADLQSGIETILLESRPGEGERPQLQVPAGVRIREARSTPRGSSWVIDCLPGRHRLDLRGRIALGAASLPAPIVWAKGAGEPSSLVRRWLVLGRGLRAGEAVGLRPAPIPREVRALTDRESELTESTSWTIVGEPGELTLVPATAGTRAARGAAVASVRAAPDGSGHWLLDAEIVWLSDSGSRVIILPPEVELLDARSESGLLTAREDGRIPLSADSPLTALRLVWRTADLGHRLRWEVPRLEAAGEPTPLLGTSWTLFVPSSRRLNTYRSITAARAELQAANDFADLARLAAPLPGGSAFHRLRGLIARHLHQAEFILGSSPADSELGPEGEPLADWLKRLRTSTPAESPTPADPRDPLAAAFTTGSPHRWHVAEGATLTGNWEDDSSERATRRTLSIALVGIILIGLLIILRRRGHQLGIPAGRSPQ